MKPDDLDDAVPPEPDAVLLGRVRARSASLRRRRRAQRFGSVVVAVGVLALAGGIALTVGGTNHSNVSGPTPSSTTTATTVPTEDAARAIIGEWRPVSIAAYQGPLTSPPLNSPSVLRFTAATKWNGSDGCNGQDGTYALDDRGSVHFAVHISTTMACQEQTPTPQSLEAATRVEIHASRLTFFGPDGELAEYARTGVTARVVLPSTTMIAGSSMTGSVVVENDTGHALHAIGCGTWLQVVLAVPGSEPIVPWTLCREQFTIPLGTSTHPARIAAGYLGCNSPPPGAPPGCPPLPVGAYQATMFESDTVVPIPPPVAVTVVARGDKSVEGLKAAALAWSNVFLTGTPDAIFAMEGAECTPTTSTTLSGSTISAYLAGERATMEQHFGMPLDAITAHGVSVRNFTGTTGEALVQYDLPESKTGNDNWVTYAVENGEWKVADCHAPIGGSSTSASSSAP